ncbi:MAG: putative signal transduction protein with domain [Myxococcaceae bacterium]|nr:putative signal transduction protein with domain [Myxococcaceae bacterium]
MAATMKIESVMTTALVTVRDTDSIGEAEAELTLGSMRHVPVVDENRNLVGMLSARDVLAALAKGKKRVRVGEYMSRDPITVTPDTPVYQAIDLLLENRFGSLPVIGNDGHLMGIVTETDILRAWREELMPSP